MAFALDDERAAMRADVGETAQLGGLVGREDERLVEASLEQGEWKHVTGRLHSRGVARPLPAPCEHRVFLESVVRRIGVCRRRKGGCTRNIRVHLDRRRIALRCGTHGP